MGKSCITLGDPVGERCTALGGPAGECSIILGDPAGECCITLGDPAGERTTLGDPAGERCITLGDPAGECCANRGCTSNEYSQMLIFAEAFRQRLHPKRDRETLEFERVELRASKRMNINHTE